MQNICIRLSSFTRRRVDSIHIKNMWSKQLPLQFLPAAPPVRPTVSFSTARPAPAVHLPQCMFVCVCVGVRTVCGNLMQFVNI